MHHPDGIVAESRHALIDRDKPLELQEWIDGQSIVDDLLDLVVCIFLCARARRDLARLEELLDLWIARVPLVAALAGEQWAVDRRNALESSALIQQIVFAVLGFGRQRRALDELGGDFYPNL